METSREIQDTLPPEYLPQPCNQEDSPRGRKKLVCMSSTPTFLRRLPKGLAFVLPSLVLWWVQHNQATWRYRRWWHELIDAMDPPHCSAWNKLMKNFSSQLLFWEAKHWSMYPASQLLWSAQRTGIFLSSLGVLTDLAIWRRAEMEFWTDRYHSFPLVQHRVSRLKRQLSAFLWGGTELV